MRLALVVALVTLVAGCAQGEMRPLETTTTTAHPEHSTSDAPPATPTPATASVVVQVKGMKFSPETITVKRGAKVTWNFVDNGVPHTVTGLRDFGMALNSPILKEGDYSYVFDRIGTYQYICTLHPNMKGTVTVVE